MVDHQKMLGALDLELSQIWLATSNLYNGFVGDRQWAIQNADISNRFALLRQYIEGATAASDADRPAAAFSAARSAMEMAYSDVLSFRFYHLKGERVFESVEAAEKALDEEFGVQNYQVHQLLAVQDPKNLKKINFLKPVLARPQNTNDVELVPGIRFLRINEIYDLRQSRVFKYLRVNQYAYNGDEDHVPGVKSFYRDELGWSSVINQLSWGNFMDEIDFERINLHYAYLSQFVHPYGAPEQQLLNSFRWSEDFKRVVYRLGIRMYGYHLALIEVETFLAYLDLQPNLEHVDREILGRILSNPLRMDVQDLLGLPGAKPTDLDLATEKQYEEDLEFSKSVETDEDKTERGFLRHDPRPYLDPNPFHRLGEQLWGLH